MENRIFILEDDQEHWSCIKSMLDSGGLNKYYPITDKEFRTLRNYLQETYSTITEKQSNAREFLHKTIEKDDFLLMDYVLKIDDININCIKIFYDLKFVNKALIYTGQTSRHFVEIEMEIRDKKLHDYIKIAMKPANLLVSYEIKDDIDFLCNKIKEANSPNINTTVTKRIKPPPIKP